MISNILASFFGSILALLVSAVIFGVFVYSQTDKIMEIVDQKVKEKTNNLMEGMFS